ncbi:uncharacterized protein LY79DRAFT_367280 [Colletotrichum navitas]|uniref:Uncharacterized protein n=1 Tax=Colletotrichum navitas TaxID=681940 RepID=A0AAD8PQJ4_9PEZI|nr:uncharacterized protein LY79DRAFT_367280 [Colletotrichum navitas]KAK1574477.1 hypothetical protein LY79DRAFT_367280 [Colletotrichum navitas]
MAMHASRYDFLGEAPYTSLPWGNGIRRSDLMEIDRERETRREREIDLGKASTHSQRENCRLTAYCYSCLVAPQAAECWICRAPHLDVDSTVVRNQSSSNSQFVEALTASPLSRQMYACVCARAPPHSYKYYVGSMCCRYLWACTGFSIAPSGPCTV